MQDSGLLFNVGGRKERLFVKSNHIIRRKFIETEVDSVLARDLGGRGGMRVIANAYRISFLGDEMFWN